MIEPRKWITRKRVHSKTHFSCSWIRKETAEPESSSDQPKFDEEGNFHRITCGREDNTHPQLCANKSVSKSAFIRVTVFHAQSSMPRAVAATATSISPRTTAPARVS